MRQLKIPADKKSYETEPKKLLLVVKSDVGGIAWTRSHWWNSAGRL